MSDIENNNNVEQKTNTDTEVNVTKANNEEVKTIEQPIKKPDQHTTNNNKSHTSSRDGKHHHNNKKGNKSQKKQYSRKKVSRLFKLLGNDKKVWNEKIDYKNTDLLRNFISEVGKIYPRRTTGLSALYHRKVVREIKKARSIALLPFRVRE